MIVVPDVGCGVFGNDPLVIGGCWGAKEVSMLMLLLIQACSMKRYEEYIKACLDARFQVWVVSCDAMLHL